MKKMRRSTAFILYAALLLCISGIAAHLVLIVTHTARAYIRTAPAETCYTARNISFTRPLPVNDTGCGTVDINKDDAARLTLLPGIGESRAKDIIEYRENVSPFFYPIDITNVKGIGQAMFENMRDRICLSAPEP